MIIIRELADVDSLRRCIKQGDILSIYDIRHDIKKYYFTYNGILTTSFEDGNCADYCYESEFRRDLRIALTESNRYFIKLIEEETTEVVRLEEGAVI